MRRKLTIAGSLAQRAGNGGHAWVLLHYLLGFARLGFDVLFLDRIEPEMCVDERGRSVGFDESLNRRYSLDVMRRFELQDQFALFADAGRRVLGRDRASVLRHVAESEFVLNIMGFFNEREVLERANRRVFLDIDPGFGQMWKALGLADIFAGHDSFVTVGLNLGRAGCQMPACGIDWIATVPPVVLDCWPVASGSGGAITGIATWRGPFGPVEYQGATYGLRVHEFRKFIDLPRRVKDKSEISDLKSGISDLKFRLALNIDPADSKDIASLKENGWELLDPQTVAADTDSYRRFIQNSFAELMIAKNMYVQSRGGWFSDRSACYLASGKPVVAQDTGLDGHFPLDEGLLTFSTPDEAAGAVESVVRDYGRHAAAARRIAEQHFDSDKVLSQLLRKLGVPA